MTNEEFEFSRRMKPEEINVPSTPIKRMSITSTKVLMEDLDENGKRTGLGEEVNAVGLLTRGRVCQVGKEKIITGLSLNVDKAIYALWEDKNNTLTRLSVGDDSSFFIRNQFNGGSHISRYRVAEVEIGGETHYMPCEIDTMIHCGDTSSFGSGDRYVSLNLVPDEYLDIAFTEGKRMLPKDFDEENATKEEVIEKNNSVVIEDCFSRDRFFEKIKYSYLDFDRKDFMLTVDGVLHECGNGKDSIKQTNQTELLEKTRDLRKQKLESYGLKYNFKTKMFDYQSCAKSKDKLTTKKMTTRNFIERNLFQ